MDCVKQQYNREVLKKIAVRVTLLDKFFDSLSFYPIHLSQMHHHD